MTLNQRFINEAAVGVVFVQGSTPDLQMSAAEQLKAAADVQEGLTWMATLEPEAKVSWVYDWKTVSINEAPWQGAPWKGLPREFYQKSIDAALWRESNGKIYMFHADQYVRLTDSTVDDGYPLPIADNWKGLPPEFQQGIDAAFWRKTNNQIYMFKGDQYIRLTETEMDAGYPKPIAGNWHELPSSFEQGIDAVFMHHGTNKIYMFKGDQYVRLTDSTMDSGYPRPIKGNFKGVPEHMEEGIQAALWRGSNDKVYLFGKHSRRTLTDYVRFSDIIQPVDAGYPKYVGGLDRGETEALWRDPAQTELGVGAGEDGYKDYVAQLRQTLGTEWGIVAFITKYPVGWLAYAGTPKIVMAWNDSDSFDRVFAHETGHTFGAPDEYSSSNCSCDSEHGRFLRAKNGNCKLCASGISMDDGYPKSIAGPWDNLPASFENGIDAALWRDDNKKVYFFKGNQYARLTDTTMDSGYPKPIAGNWNNLPASFESGIDATVWRKSNNRIYMFKGSQYVRLTDSTVDDGYPLPIAGNWKGLPPTFEQGVDAVVWREVNDKIYMFKGSQYVRLTGSTMDSGYPKPIAGNWKGLPSSFEQGIDAAFLRESNGKIYMFKGDQYVRLTETEMDAGYPEPIAGNWPGLPSGFTSGLDAALMRWDTHKIYFFRGRTYVRYSNVAEGIDPGYPQWINKSWMPFPT